MLCDLTSLTRRKRRAYHGGILQHDVIVKQEETREKEALEQGKSAHSGHRVGGVVGFDLGPPSPLLVVGGNSKIIWNFCGGEKE